MRCLGSIDINNITYPLAQLSDYSFIRSTEDFRWVYKDGSATQQYISSTGTDFIPVLKPYPTTFGESAYKPFSNYRAKFEYWSYRNSSGPQDLRIGIRIDDEENTILSSGGWGYDDSYLRLYVAIVLDDANERGYIVYSYYVQGEHPEQYADGYGMSINGGNSTSGRLIYDIFGYNGGGAGSGYIGNSLLSNKKMVGYNVPTSSAEGTKTESVNDVSASAVSGKPKSGNGFAKIKFLREVIPDEDDWYSFETHIGTWTNGKPVYQIAIPNIDKTLTRNWDVLADVSSLNIDEIIKIDLLGIANSQYYGSLVGLYGAQVCLDGNNIVGYAYNSNIVPYAQTVKLRYTKTTD